jgi:hypothetical protein
LREEVRGSRGSSLLFLEMRVPICLLLLVVATARATSPATPYSYVIAPESNCFFTMQLGKLKSENGEIIQVTPGHGVAYRLKGNGEFKKLWEVKGWYSFPHDLFLSLDGKSLVRVREDFMLPDGSFLPEDGCQDVLQVYRKGTLVVSYTTQDLIGDIKNGLRADQWFLTSRWIRRDEEAGPRIGPSLLYQIEKDGKGPSPSFTRPDVFQLTTIEGNHFLFDLKTGSTVKKVARQKEDEKDAESPEEEVDPFATGE